VQLSAAARLTVRAAATSNGCMTHATTFLRAFVAGLALVAALLVSGVATADESPLTLAKQGSFFVGGETRTIAPNTDITVHQMYVQYQIPVTDPSAARPSVVMVHGCCLSAKSWEETPDGRMGWSEYFVRRGYPTYLVDQVTRARSGFDPSVFNRVRTGAAAPDTLPNILTIGHQATWTAFRFGPTPGEPYPDTQFPVEHAAEFYKQMIPDLNLMLGPYSGPNPTFNNLTSLAREVWVLSPERGAREHGGHPRHDHHRTWWVVYTWQPTQHAVDARTDCHTGQDSDAGAVRRPPLRRVRQELSGLP
jgi:hypothetical protein